jgi:two-component system, NarL family, response regulator DegU
MTDMGVSTENLVRLVIIDDHAMFREGLVRVLEREQDLKVVGEFASSSEALQSLHESEADVRYWTSISARNAPSIS